MCVTKKEVGRLIRGRRGNVFSYTDTKSQWSVVTMTGSVPLVVPGGTVCLQVVVCCSNGAQRWMRYLGFYVSASQPPVLLGHHGQDEDVAHCVVDQ